MAQVNGTAPSTPSSAFFSHLFSYPLIHDCYNTFKSNPYGAKSLSLTTASYEKLGKPLVPYLSKPYEYVSPYVARADSIGDSTLSSLESKFPVVKKPTGELYNEGKELVFLPLKIGGEGREYVMRTYKGEVTKVGKNGGLVSYGKAILVTGLVVSSDALSWLGGFLGKKKEQVKDVTNEKMAN